MSAIEVLKGIKNTGIVVECIVFNFQNEGYPYEEKDITNAVSEALLALEKQENDMKQGAIEELEKMKLIVNDDENTCCIPTISGDFVRVSKLNELIEKRLKELGVEEK